MSDKTYWVYILLCDNGHYYTGYTTDLERRFQEHIAGTIKCKYTRSFKPIRIEQTWKIEGEKSEAMKLEKYIKKLNKKEKERLISAPDGIPRIKRGTT
jgi:putative endonuclease